MDIPKNILDKAIENTHKIFEGYERNHRKTLKLDKKQLTECVRRLYDEEKEVKFVDNIHEIKTILEYSEKPWVYHYSLNLNWVVFFTIFYEHIYSHIPDEEKADARPIYYKTLNLKWILENVDGIIEDKNIVYLVKDDATFIKGGLQKWTI